VEVVTAFGETDPYTLGVEEEFQILDPDDFGLVSRADEILGKGTDYEENLRTELFQAVVETASDVCQDVDEVREEVHRLRRGLADVIEDKGYKIAAAGTHPFALWEDQDHTESDRYEDLIDEVGWPARRDLIFGLHVHVAVRNPGEAIYVNNHIRPFLPLVLALSANSPFWQAEETGLMATRTRIFDAMPRTGMPTRFANWTDFTQTLERLKAVGSIEDVTRIWWDTRPRPDLGTVEIRMADLPTDPRITVALTALIQALVVRLSRAHRAGEQPPVRHEADIIEENRWRAIKDGIHAEFIQYDNVDGVERMPIDRVLSSTIDHLAEVPRELGIKEELSLLVDRAERSEAGADRQLAVREREGSLQAVAGDLADRTVP
jgi:carboxylate-amine ligase